MIARVVLIIGLLQIATSVAAQTLTEAVETTLLSNPDVLASQYNVEAADELRKQAKGGYFPTVDLALGGGREWSNNSTTAIAGIEDLELTREERSLQVTQLLYDGFSTMNLVRQQKSLLESAIARLTDSQQNTSLRAIQVYLDVLRRDEIVRLAQGNLEQHEDTLAKIRERFESGVGTRVDVVQTRGRRSQAKSNVLLAERDAANARAQFLRVVGAASESLSRPDAINGLPETLDQSIEIAMSNNPALDAAEADLNAAASARKQAKGAFHPRVDLQVGATRNDNIDGVPGRNDDEVAMLRLTYNLYRGGSDLARKNEAEAREFSSREVLRSNQLRVTEDVTLIWNDLENLKLRLEYLENHVSSTEEVVRVYNEQLTLGKRTLLDLLDVKNELLRAQIAYVSAEYSLILARYRLLAGTGMLFENMQIEPPTVE